MQGTVILSPWICNTMKWQKIMQGMTITTRKVNVKANLPEMPPFCVHPDVFRYFYMFRREKVIKSMLEVVPDLADKKEKLSWAGVQSILVQVMKVSQNTTVIWDQGQSLFISLAFT